MQKNTVETALSFLSFHLICIGTTRTTEFSVFHYYLCVLYFSEDILVFLTGQEEIESVVKSIRDISRDLPSGIHVVPQSVFKS